VAAGEPAVKRIKGTELWELKFSEETSKSLVALCAQLCLKYGFDPIKDIYRHYDVSGKMCPLWHAGHQSDWDSLKEGIKRALAGMSMDKSASPEMSPEKTPIEGSPEISASALAAWLLESNPAPKLACAPLELAEAFIQEGLAEGIRGDIAFCQAMHETGWLKFGGQVSPGQNNFAGIGATNGGAAGASFSTPQEGARAQIQHLKAYASKEPLKLACVDPRFGLVQRGCAPCWEDLNGRWAVPGASYGQSILKLFAQAKERAAGIDADVRSAVAALAAKGVISSPDYWLLSLGKLEHLGNLLVRMAKALAQAT
jgi:hypothetical protein